MFQTDANALRGKNFFHLMSAYSRKHTFEIFGQDIFKTFKETSRVFRYSLPHMDDVDFDNFKVLISKIMLVKPKIRSPLDTDPFMIKIVTRRSSLESRKRLYGFYKKARQLLRETQAQQIEQLVKDSVQGGGGANSEYHQSQHRSAFNRISADQSNS